MIKLVAVSIPSMQKHWKHFLTHGNQDFFEKWLALGLGRKYMR